jgi:hypothetical protein
MGMLGNQKDRPGRDDVEEEKEVERDKIKLIVLEVAVFALDSGCGTVPNEASRTFDKEALSSVLLPPLSLGLSWVLGGRWYGLPRSLVIQWEKNGISAIIEDMILFVR